MFHFCCDVAMKARLNGSVTALTMTTVITQTQYYTMGHTMELQVGTGYLVGFVVVTCSLAMHQPGSCC